MSNEGRLLEQQTRGDQAKALLRNPLIKEAFEKIESEILDAWKESRADEEKQRNNAYLMHRLFKNFENHFTQMVLKGDAAKKDLLRIKDPKRYLKMINS